MSNTTVRFVEMTVRWSQDVRQCPLSFLMVSVLRETTLLGIKASQYSRPSVICLVANLTRHQRLEVSHNPSVGTENTRHMRIQSRFDFTLLVHSNINFYCLRKEISSVGANEKTERHPPSLTHKGNIYWIPSVRFVCNLSLLLGLYPSYVTTILPWHLFLRNNNPAASSFT